jgi:hypothetical protein
LSNNDGTNDFTTIYSASSGTQVVSNNSFNGGSYIVTQQGIASSPPRVKIRSVATGPNGSTAQVEAWLQSSQLFGCQGICSGGLINLSGDSTIDSYNSSQGAYGGANVGSNGNLATNGNITLSGGLTRVNGNATAHGTVTASGGSAVTGTTTQSAPTVSYPSVAACGPPYSSGAGLSGTYTYSSATGILNLSGSGSVTLAAGTYCFNSVTLSGSSTLTNSGVVTINLIAKSDFSGGSIVNSTGTPSSLTIQSSYSSSSDGIVLSGGSGAKMVVNCPLCQVKLSGSGNVYGAIIAGSYDSSGGGQLHYDTALGGASNTNVKMYGWVQTF